MYTRRNLLRDFSQLTLLGVLGCQTKTEPRGRDQIVREFKFQKRLLGQKLRVLYPKGSLSNLKPVVERFEAATHSKVELIESALSEIASELQILHSLGSKNQMVDVALPPTFSLPDLVESGVIADLSTFSAQYEPESLKFEMLFPDGDVYKGKFYGYQTDGDVYLMFLNKRILRLLSEQLGRTESDLIPKNWKDLDELLKLANKPTKDQWGGLLFRNRHFIHWEYWSRLHTLGRLPFAHDMASQLTSDESFDTLEAMTQASQSLHPKTFRNDLFENWECFAKGNTLINLGWGGTYKYLKRSLTDIENEILVAPLPRITLPIGTTDFGYFNWGWNLVVMEKSQQQQLAYLFCLFASLPEESTLSVQSIDGYFDPHRIAHFQDEKIRALYGTNFLEVQRSSMQSAIPDLYLQSSGAYFSALKQGLHSAITGLTKPKVALQLIENKWNQITENIGVTRQQQQWKELLNKYPNSIRAILK